MGYCVYHFEKGKSQATAIGNHIDRTEGKEYSYKNADSSRKQLNQNFIVNDFCKIPLQKAINERIAEGYEGKKAIRKDAVRYLKHVLTGSHEDMIKISQDKAKFKNWINANFNFMIKEFGKDNIVRFSLHMDERTPHIHCITVPLTKDGKLSAKIMTGDKKALQERQTRYAEAMRQFGLERGVKGSKSKHTTVIDYYKKVNEIDKTSITLPWVVIEQLPNIEKPTKREMLFGKLDEWKERQERELLRWKNNTEKKLKKKIENVGNKAIEEIKTKRFKDVSFVFAQKSKQQHQNTLKSLKNSLVENNQLQETIRDLEIEKEIAKNQVIAQINDNLKGKGLKLTINNGNVKFIKIQELKKNKKRGM